MVSLLPYHNNILSMIFLLGTDGVPLLEQLRLYCYTHKIEIPSFLEV
jgi:hypothetical protein